jgi:hypothetical protein
VYKFIKLFKIEHDFAKFKSLILVLTIFILQNFLIDFRTRHSNRKPISINKRQQEKNSILLNHSSHFIQFACFLFSSHKSTRQIIHIYLEKDSFTTAMAAATQKRVHLGEVNEFLKRTKNSY